MDEAMVCTVGHNKAALGIHNDPAGAMEARSCTLSISVACCAIAGKGAGGACGNDHADTVASDLGDKDIAVTVHNNVP